MSNEQPHFLFRKIQDHQRHANRQLACSLCSSLPPLIGTHKLLDHTRTEHPDIAVDYPDGPRWRQFLSEASTKAKQRNARKLGPDTLPVSKESSNGSMQNNIGDDARSRSTNSRPVSAPALRPPGPRIDDFNRLRIDQGSDPPGEVQPTALSPNRLKRSAGQSGGLDQPRNVGDGRSAPKNRRTKALSGGDLLSTTDQDVTRESKSGTSKRLYQPNVDGTSFVNSHRGNFGFSSSHNPDPKGNGRERRENLAKKDSATSPALRTQQSIKRELPPPTNENTKESIDVGSSRNYTAPSETSETSVDEPELLLQPETRPISHEQLVVEVKGIYAGLVMVEAKCIDVDDKQTIAAQEKDPSKQSNLSFEQWSALIALHKTLLHEHHDFFLASQHPSASPALSRLAAKYSMPARMWRHGIHAFLEVLRHRLPASLDHMLAFIYIAYSMMALLYETVPSFEDTWIECLGDLGRYRMAIEDDDAGDREVWSGVARFWYGKAADKSPRIGRLYHHLAILAKPYTIQQLSLYARSLTCIFPFESAKGSIMTLFNPVLGGQHIKHQKSSSAEAVFLRAYALLYTGQSTQEYETLVGQLLDGGLFEKLIARMGSKFRETGVLVAIISAAALLEYGVSRSKGGSRSIIRLALDRDRARQESAKADSAEIKETALPPSASNLDGLNPQEFELSRNAIAHACTIAFGLLTVALRRPLDNHVFPMIHTYLVFIWHMCSIDGVMEHIEREIPWPEFVSWLTTHITPQIIKSTSQRKTFPKPEHPVIGRPLPEDFPTRGQPWAQKYYPEGWFDEAAVDDEERVLELASMAEPRLERIFWLAFGIVSYGRWISFDSDARRFLETPYAKGLRPRESKTPLQPIKLPEDVDSVMSGMTDTEETPYSVLDNPQRHSLPSDSGAGEESEEPKKIVLTKPPTILKRLPKEDAETVHPSLIKQEQASSPSKPVSYESETWLKGQDSSMQQPLRKHNPEDHILQGSIDLIDAQHIRDPDKS